MAAWFTNSWNRNWHWKHGEDHFAFDQKKADQWQDWRNQRMDASKAYKQDQLCPNCGGIDLCGTSSESDKAMTPEKAVTREALVEHIRESADRSCHVCQMVIQAISEFGLLTDLVVYWGETITYGPDHPYMWTSYGDQDSRRSVLVPIPREFIYTTEENDQESKNINLSPGRFCETCHDFIYDRRSHLRSHGSQQNPEYGRVVFGDTATVVLQVSCSNGTPEISINLEYDRETSTTIQLYSVPGRASRWNWIPFKPHFPESSRSVECFNMLKDWLHDTDIDNSLPNVFEPQLPSRVLDLSSNTVKLFETKGLKGRYATLSHCWGRKSDGHEPPKLMKANRQDWQIEIPATCLNAIIRDAVTVACEVGIRYLWVDSLCIIQDDPHDWAQESSQMCEIYHNSYLSIMNPKATNGSTSLFGGSRYTTAASGYYRHPLLVHEEPADSQYASVYAAPCLEHYSSDLKSSSSSLLPDSPLFSRGWVFQEYILAPRVIMYGLNEMVLFTNHTTKCECGKAHYSSGTKQDLWKQVRHDISLRNSKSLSADESEYDRYFWPNQRFWHILVQNYSGLNLTKETDRLPALAGLAKFLNRGLRDTEYCAGLWQENLLEDLRWSVRQESKRPHDYVGPSWSWVSVSGEVRFHSSALSNRKIVIESCCCTPDGPDQYGQISGASLRVSAFVRDVYLEWDDKASEYSIYLEDHAQVTNNVGIVTSPETVPTAPAPISAPWLDPTTLPQEFGRIDLDQKDPSPPNEMTTSSSPIVGSILPQPEPSDGQAGSGSKITGFEGQIMTMFDARFVSEELQNKRYEPDYEMKNVKNLWERDQSMNDYFDQSGDLKIPLEMIFGLLGASSGKEGTISLQTDIALSDKTASSSASGGGDRGGIRTRIQALAVLLGDLSDGDEEVLLLRKSPDGNFERIGWVEHKVQNEIATGPVIGGGHIYRSGPKDETWFVDGERKKLTIM